MVNLGAPEESIMSDDSTRDIIISRLEQLTGQLSAFRTEVTESLTALNERLTAVEAKQYDTRPIWQAVEARLERLEEKFDRLSDKFDVVTGHLVSVQADSYRSSGVSMISKATERNDH